MFYSFRLDVEVATSNDHAERGEQQAVNSFISLLIIIVVNNNRSKQVINTKQLKTMPIIKLHSGFTMYWTMISITETVTIMRCNEV